MHWGDVRSPRSAAGRLAPVLLVAVAAAVAATPPTPEPDPEPRVVLPDESDFSQSPQDGGGTVVVSPDVVPVSSPVTLTFVYTAGDKGIEPGGGVLCYVSSFWGWTPPQNRRPDAAGYVTVRTPAPGVELDVEVDPSNQTVLARIQGRRLRGGDTVTLVYGDTSDGKHAAARGRSDRFAERQERFFFKVDGDGDGWFAPLESQPRFQVEARQAARLAAFGPSRAVVGNPFQLTIAALDGSNNLVESFEGEVRLVARGATSEHAEAVRFRPDDRGAVRVGVTPGEPGIIRLIAADPENVLSPAMSNPCVVAESSNSTYSLFWADLHGHSNVSDGTGTPEDFYRYARDVARLDAAALTDHDH